VAGGGADRNVAGRRVRRQEPRLVVLRAGQLLHGVAERGPRGPDDVPDRCASKGRPLRRPDHVQLRRQGAAQPGYTVHYLPAAQATLEDGSGRQLKIAGKAFLVVRIFPAATAIASGDKLEFTYRGKRLQPAGMRHVKEIVKTGDFEAVVTWAIGLDGNRPFKLSGSSSAPGFTVEIG